MLGSQRVRKSLQFNEGQHEGFVCVFIVHFKPDKQRCLQTEGATEEGDDS